ncbi:Phage tail sheath protein FI [Caballeronia glathei]|uniref:Tail protein n=1 Tax=Caballeronia glathei TaxID=60547 RepID=A0A069PGH5_9BURK|nr:phage tail sheath C-terminal domain-containing protein [Caballeronia glathei]KDR38954.1 tail protein [Caballeronia glathei]CDY77242.1 Phage tail sheath protein FI [Caballeronia glathei]
MAQFKTPGVYVVEKNAFRNSVVEVATAVPAFIGHTEFAVNAGIPLAGKPRRISSMAEFIHYFGGAPNASFSIDEQVESGAGVATGDFAVTDPAAGKPDEYVLKAGSPPYILYYSMLLFFQNGGGTCYIVSAGSYGDDLDAGRISTGIDALLAEQEPTLVVVPEAVHLSATDCAAVQKAMLAHCGSSTRNRFAVLDIRDGYRDRRDPDGDCIAAFRESIGTGFLEYGAAYYPWLETSIVGEKDLDFTAIANLDVLTSLLKQELSPVLDDTNPSPKARTRIDALNALLASITSDRSKSANPASDVHSLHQNLSNVSRLYPSILAAIRKKLNLLPPAAGIAGIYTMVDNARGVWSAPANVSVNAVVSPAVPISDEEQGDLNIDTQGKSVNAVRAFTGRGPLVWGARTLDGNSLDWRYVNVRRTVMMIEASIMLACRAYVFEPNAAGTWITIKSMVRNFLTDVWKRGGLAGASQDDAFVVAVGLGETMTAGDILAGLLKVSVQVAVSGPAEFIALTFEQQMQAP